MHSCKLQLITKQPLKPQIDVPQPRKAWSRDVKGGHCVSKHIILTSAHVWSGVSIGLDVYYAVGLIPLIWGLQIPRAVKCSTIIILGLGIL